MSSQCPQANHALDVTEAPILPRHLYAGTDVEKNPVNMRPVGTGPFRFVSFEQGEINLVRNTEYLKPALPLLDKVVMRVIPDAGTRLLALQNGEVDWIHERRASVRTPGGCVPRPTSGCCLAPGPRVEPTA